MGKIYRIAALAAAALATVSLSGGCAFHDMVSDITQPKEQENVGVERETKKAVSNSLSVGIINYDTFNPLLTGSETVKECMQFVYEPLFDTDENLRPVPVLADGYNLSPDGRIIEVTLKQNVTWHDGSAFTADDVIYTFNQIRAARSPYEANIANVAKIAAADEYTLQISLNYASSDFVSMLSFPIVKSRSDMKADASFIPLGTGPYMYYAQTGRERVVFTAYDAYHGGRAKIDTLNAAIIPDLAKYQSMFEASEIDLMTGETVDLSEYTPRGSAKNNEYVTNKMTYIGFNTQNERLFGNQTRRALSELIDKDSIVNSTIYSKGVAVDIPFNPSSAYYYDVATRFRRDETLALELLGNESWGVNSNGEYTRILGTAKQTLTLELLCEKESAQRMNIAEKIAKEYTEFGIKTTVTALGHDEFLARINAKNYEAFISEINIPPNLDLSALISSAGNAFSYQNADVDTLIGQLGMTKNIDEQKELYKELGAKLVDDMPFTPLFFRKGDVLATSKIKSQVVPSITREYRNTESWSVTE